MEKKYKIAIKSIDDSEENLQEEFYCNGFALLAFDAEMNGDTSQAMVNIENASIEDIKDVIKGDAHLIAAACMAKGELDAEKYFHKIRSDEIVKGFLGKMKDMMK